MKYKKVTKAVISAAGYGTRFLPATKNIPKELLPIINVPTLQLVVDECVESGIEDIIVVTRYGNSAIENYFDSSPELERYLEEKGKHELAEKVRDIYTKANFAFVRQTKTLPYGNGSPLLAAKPLIDDNEAFLYLYGDDLVFGEPAAREIMERYYVDQPAAVLGVTEVDFEKTTPGGMVDIEEGTEDKVANVIEKPTAEESPSNLQSMGRYLFTYKIFDHLDPQKTGKGDELWTVDAAASLAKVDNVVVKPLTGEWKTTGDPIHFLEALFEYVVRQPELKDKFAELISEWHERK